MSRRWSSIPQPASAHRTVTAVDTPIPPLSSNADWYDTDERPVARVHVNTAFVGGTNPSVDLSVWIKNRGSQDVARSPDPDNRWQVGLLTVTGDDDVAFDVMNDGDDVLVLVEAVAGAPTSFTVTMKISGR